MFGTYYSQVERDDDDSASEWVDAVLAEWEGHLGRLLTVADEQRIHNLIDAYRDGEVRSCRPPGAEDRT